MSFATPVWDQTIFEFFHSTRNQAFDFLAPLFSSSVFLWGVVLVGLFFGLRGWPRRHQVLVVLSLLALLGMADGGTNIVKNQVGRVRPLNALASVYFHEDGKWQQRPADFVQTKEKGSSFPSAHAANSMGVAVLLAFFFPACRKSIWLFPLLVGWSRFYLAKHYPLDVCSGWIFGAVMAAIICAVLLSLCSRSIKEIRWRQNGRLQ